MLPKIKDHISGVVLGVCVTLLNERLHKGDLLEVTFVIALVDCLQEQFLIIRGQNY